MNECTLGDLVDRTNSFDPSLIPCLPFYINDAHVGWIRKEDVLPRLKEHPDIFIITNERVSLHASLDTPESRTHRISTLLNDWRQNKTFKCLQGWRNEAYPVFHVDADRSDNHLMLIERSAVHLFGIRAFGTHMNGFVRYPDGSLKMWVARRSPTKQTYPGYLDNLVGGGLSLISPRENIIKEAMEEAGISETLMESARAVGCTSFRMNSERGIILDTDYIFDLELDAGFQPAPMDGEVAELYLWSLEKVMKHLRHQEFTPESGLVVIDFLIRHGYITEENEPDYYRIIRGLHQ